MRGGKESKDHCCIFRRTELRGACQCSKASFDCRLLAKSHLGAAKLRKTLADICDLEVSTGDFIEAPGNGGKSRKSLQHMSNCQTCTT